MLTDEMKVKLESMQMTTADWTELSKSIPGEEYADIKHAYAVKFYHQLPSCGSKAGFRWCKWKEDIRTCLCDTPCKFKRYRF